MLSLLLGLIIGSFLNVCIFRIPHGDSIISPPSHCPKCNQRLGVVDLVPVFSYLLLKGKCRYCGDEVSPRYPLVELFCGVIFFALFLKFGYTLEYVSSVFLFSGLLVCSLIDYDHQIIPDKVNLVLFIGGVTLIGLQSTTLLLNGFLGAVVGFGLLYLVAVLSKGGMGGGDVKLAGVLGLYLGWQNVLLTLFMAFLIGSVVGLAWALINNKNLKTALPFGPFLSIATMLVIIWGQQILSWYFEFVLK